MKGGFDKLQKVQIQKTRLFAFSIVIAIIISSPVFAAELYGTIYTTDLYQAKDVVVTVNSVPEQRVVSHDGTYSLILEPGEYELQVYENNNQNQTTTEHIIISGEGRFNYDLFLLPDVDLEELDDAASVFDDSLLLDQYTYDEPETPVSVLFRLFIVLIIAGFFYVVWRFLPSSLVEGDSPSTTKTTLASPTARTSELVDEDLVRIVELLQKEQGRMTQRALRKEFSHSEAKMSLLLAELESKGYIEKIKKGRGNILLLKKENKQ